MPEYGHNVMTHRVVCSALAMSRRVSGWAAAQAAVFLYIAGHGCKHGQQFCTASYSIWCSGYNRLDFGAVRTGLNTWTASS